MNQCVSKYVRNNTSLMPLNNAYAYQDQKFSPNYPIFQIKEVLL